MFSDDFLHPNYVIPLPEFLSALVEVRHLHVTHLLVEMHTVLCQMLVLRIDLGNAGIEIENPLLFECSF